MTERRIDPFEVLLEAQTGQLVVSYVVIAETLAPDGTRNLYTHAHAEQSATVTVGLLECVSATEKFRIARHLGRNPEQQ